MMKKAVFAVGAALLAAAGAVWAQTPQGVTDNEIVIGTHLDLSGPIAFWGVPQRNGHLMAVEEINAAGGIHGRKIRLVIEDNGYDMKKGVLASQKLIQQDKVFALVGVLGTPISIATMPLAIDAGVPWMYPGSPARAMWDPYHKLKFSLAHPYDESIKAGVRWFAGKKKRVAIIYQDDEYGKDIRDAVAAQLKASGMELASEASYKRGDTAFSSQVARVRQANPDLLVLGTVVRETVGVAAEAQKVGWKIDILTPAAACNQAVPDLGKDATEGLYILCQYVPLYYEDESPAVKDWMTRYEKRFSAKPDVSAGITYDMYKLMAIAFERAGRDITIDKFIKATETIKNWQNIFGSPPLSFGPKPEERVGTRTVVLTQIQGGKFKRLLGGKPLE